MLKGARLVVLALAIAIGMARSAGASAADVQFTDKPGSAAIRAAVSALRFSPAHAGENIPLSEVSAALVSLVDGRPPQLFVQLTGGYCGSLGCAISLFEQGTAGWLAVNDWQIGKVAVSSHRTGPWHDLVLDDSIVWARRGQRYAPAGELGRQ